MWTILKYDKKYLYLLKRDLSNRVGRDLEFYIPKIKIQKYIKNKLCNFENNLIGNYLLCYHHLFANSNVISSLQYCRGLKFFLTNYINAQEEINKFIWKCKKHENKEGYIQQSFFEFENINKSKFISGPFTNLVFNLISENNKMLNVQIDKFCITVPKNSYLFRPV